MTRIEKEGKLNRGIDESYWRERGDRFEATSVFSLEKRF